ncbi:MAG: cobalamin-dependent protein [Pirellulaceae bacterium]
MNNTRPHGIRRVALLNPFQITSDGYDLDVVRNKGQATEAPLGLAYIAGYLKQHAYQAKVFDAHLMAVKGFTRGQYTHLQEVEDALIQDILDYQPDVVGISCLFHFLHKTAMRLAARIKASNPSVIIVMGGAYPTCSTEDALSHAEVDYAILGEGERPLLRLLESLNGRLPFDELIAIGYRNAAGQPVVRRTLDVIKSLDSNDRPDRTDIAVEDYFRYGRHFIQRFEALAGEELRIATVTASRGCVYKCTFCLGQSIWGPTLRHRSPANILDELQYLKTEHGINCIAFNDDNLCIIKPFATELLQGMIDRRLDMKWTTGGIGVRSLLDRDLVRLMIESGCLIFNMAVESGCQETLDSIKKPVSLNDVRRAVENVRSFEGTYLMGLFMLGFPEETEEQFFHTIQFGKSLQCDWTLYGCLTPYPGTAVFEEVTQKGMIPPDIREDFEQLSFRNYVINPRYLERTMVPREAYFANLDQNFFDNPNLHNGRSEIALSDFENVLKLAPDHASAYYCMGRIFSSRGEHAKARQYFVKAQYNLSGYHEAYFDKLGIDLNVVLSHSVVQ